MPVISDEPSWAGRLMMPGSSGVAPAGWRYAEVWERAGKPGAIAQVCPFPAGQMAASGDPTPSFQTEAVSKEKIAYILHKSCAQA